MGGPVFYVSAAYLLLFGHFLCSPKIEWVAADFWVAAGDGAVDYQEFLEIATRDEDDYAAERKIKIVRARHTEYLQLCHMALIQPETPNEVC